MMIVNSSAQAWFALIIAAGSAPLLGGCCEQPECKCDRAEVLVEDVSAAGADNASLVKPVERYIEFEGKFSDETPVRAQVDVAQTAGKDFPWAEAKSLTTKGFVFSSDDELVPYIKKLEITTDDGSVLVRSDAIDDLFYPNEVSVYGAPSEYVVEIKGSTGAGSWACSLYINNGRVVRRMLMDLQFTDQLFIETNFTYPD